jgi:hypothetical protein
MGRKGESLIILTREKNSIYYGIERLLLFKERYKMAGYPKDSPNAKQMVVGEVSRGLQEIYKGAETEEKRQSVVKLAKVISRVFNAYVYGDTDIKFHEHLGE